MDHCLSVRLGAALTIALMLVPAVAATGAAAEQASVLAWRQNRSSSLTSDSGWLTLAGLFWLKDGDNSFGSEPGNDLVLDNASLAPKAGTFTLSGSQVSFTPAADAGILLNGRAVDSTAPVKLASDAGGEPTELASGALRFFVIERSGRLGVRVRDLKNPRRLQFRGLTYFPIDNKWALRARFVAYQPARRIKIINILTHADAAMLQKLADAAGRGDLAIPVAATFKLAALADAHKALAAGARGKIVVLN